MDGRAAYHNIYHVLDRPFSSWEDKNATALHKMPERPSCNASRLLWRSERADITCDYSTLQYAGIRTRGGRGLGYGNIGVLKMNSHAMSAFVSLMLRLRLTILDRR